MRKFKVGDTVGFKRNCPYVFSSKNAYGVIVKVTSKDTVYVKVCDNYFDNTKSYTFFTRWLNKLK